MNFRDKNRTRLREREKLEDMKSGKKKKNRRDTKLKIITVEI